MDRRTFGFPPLTRGRSSVTTIVTPRGKRRHMRPRQLCRADPVHYSEGEAALTLTPLSFAERSSKAARVVVASSIKNCW